jgi:ABC-type lipoprotein release transport system permease subunit
MITHSAIPPLGTVGGVLLALNVETIVPAIEEFFGVNFMAADVYYISSFDVLFLNEH